MANYYFRKNAGNFGDPNNWNSGGLKRSKKRAAARIIFILLMTFFAMQFSSHIYNDIDKGLGVLFGVICGTAISIMIIIFYARRQ